MKKILMTLTLACLISCSSQTTVQSPTRAIANAGNDRGLVLCRNTINNRSFYAFRIQKNGFSLATYLSGTLPKVTVEGRGQFLFEGDRVTFFTFNADTLDIQFIGGEKPTLTVNGHSYQDLDCAVTGIR